MCNKKCTTKCSERVPSSVGYTHLGLGLHGLVKDRSQLVGSLFRTILDGLLSVLIWSCHFWKQKDWLGLGLSKKGKKTELKQTFKHYL